MDDFDPDWTPNTTDAGSRRYRFGAQEQIAYWNLARFAESLAPVFESIDPLQRGLARYVDELSKRTMANIAGKLGFSSFEDDDLALFRDLQELLHQAEVDMTIFFRRLADVDLDAPTLEPLEDAFYDPARRQEAAAAFEAWLARYAARARQDEGGPARQARMDRANPRYVLRNYLAQEAIDRAERGDYAGIDELLEVLRRPYDDQPGAAAFDRKRPEWARHRAGCSMLSCSS